MKATVQFIFSKWYLMCLCVYKILEWFVPFEFDLESFGLCHSCCDIWRKTYSGWVVCRMEYNAKWQVRMYSSSRNTSIPNKNFIYIGTHRVTEWKHDHVGGNGARSRCLLSRHIFFYFGIQCRMHEWIEKQCEEWPKCDAGVGVLHLIIAQQYGTSSMRPLSSMACATKTAKTNQTIDQTNLWFSIYLHNSLIQCTSHSIIDSHSLFSPDLYHSGNRNWRTILSVVIKFIRET